MAVESRLGSLYNGMLQYNSAPCTSFLRAIFLPGSVELAVLVPTYNKVWGRIIVFFSQAIRARPLLNLPPQPLSHCVPIVYQFIFLNKGILFLKQNQVRIWDGTAGGLNLPKLSSPPRLASQERLFLPLRPESGLLCMRDGIGMPCRLPYRPHSSSSSSGPGPRDGRANGGTFRSSVTRRAAAAGRN